MSLALNLDTTDLPSGWVLLEARLGRHCQYTFPSLSIKRRPNPNVTEEIPLPVIGGGWIFELVELLKDDVAELACQSRENKQARQ